MSLMLGDDVMSVDLDNMMQGIPPAPHTPVVTAPVDDDDDDDSRPRSGLSQLGGQDPSILALTPGTIDDDDISSVCKS